MPQVANRLRIADRFALPVDAVSQTFAILGIRGSGKTNTAVVMTEELLKAKQQIVVLDPVDVWWGLKSSKSGKEASYSIPVIGGDHSDVPLDGGAGIVLADFVTDTRASVIFSLRHLSMNDQRKFAGDFAKRLYERKGQQRSPLMVVVDEADEFVPQRLPRGHEAMFGAFDRLVRRGRSSGIGVTLISQRAQVVNKDVLSQVEALIGMRVLHKLDRKALEAWIEAHDTEGRQEEFLASLASLGRGEAWIWSPSWLNVFERVKIRERETFDSSATPKGGEALASPKEVAPVDLEKLRQQMSVQIEKAKADDPRELRRKIADLERELAKARTSAPAPDPRILAERESEIRKEAARSVHQEYGEVMLDIAEAADKLNEALRAGRSLAQFVHTITEPKRPALPPAPRPVPARAALPRPAAQQSATGEKIPLAERKVLAALARYSEGRSKVQIALLCGYAHSGGGFNNALSALRTKGWIADERGLVVITEAGLSAIGPVEPLPRGEDLQRYWLGQLGKAERLILEALIRSYPRSLSKEHVAEMAGYAPSGGGFNNALSRLRTFELISGKGELVASEVLFE